MADCEQAHLGEFIYDTYVQEEPMHIESIGHAKERIVRCRDCRHYDEIIHACDHPCVTPLRGDCPENWVFSCFDNDFCKWGKRRADA